MQLSRSLIMTASLLFEVFGTSSKERPVVSNLRFQGGGANGLAYR
jgi:hypothetical protein